MKLSSPKAANLSAQRRNNLQLERQQAAVVRDLYPSLGHLQVSLVFDDGTRRTPSPQGHTFFPAARAFFRFACPCAECDGEFDLREVVGELLDGMSPRQRAAGVSAKGRLSCNGVRLRDRVGSRPCAMTLEYKLAAAGVE